MTGTVETSITRAYCKPCPNWLPEQTRCLICGWVEFRDPPPSPVNPCHWRDVK